jgi:hypothetical protein
MTPRLRSHALVALALALLASPSPGVRGAGPVIATGSLFGDGARLDGARVPSGTTVWSDSRVEAVGAPAVIHFGTGQTVRLEDGARARVEAASAADVRLHLERGAMVLASASGEVGRFDAPLQLELGAAEQGGAPAGGTSTSPKANKKLQITTGVVAGVLTAGLILLNQVDDDDEEEPPASPIVP